MTTAASVHGTTSAASAAAEPRVARERFPVRFLAAHVLLGVVVAHSTMLSTVYGAATIGVVLWWAASSQDLTRVAAGAGYVAGSDVLWRATHAHLPWEGGKYALVAVCLVALVRSVRQLREPLLPLLFFGLLLPSIVLTVTIDGLLASRQDISFNLSGPLALAVAALFFSQLRAGWSDVRRILLAMVGPAVALATMATSGIAGNSLLKFGSQSNFQTSAGFGPNQVSNALSIGALACLLLVLNDRRPLVRLTEAIVGIALFGQSVLTFSRGGAFSLVVAGGLGVLVVVIQGRSRVRTLVAIALIGLLAFLVFSNINSFTNGALDKRFSDTSTTGRSDIAKQDLQIWSQHRLAGVGPGMAARYRESGTSRDRAQPAHTEFTRLLSEHGTLGLLAMGVLLAMWGRAVIRAPGAWQRAIAMSLPAWALVTMSHSAMRIAPISFAFGLGMVHLRSDRIRARPS